MATRTLVLVCAFCAVFAPHALAQPFGPPRAVESPDGTLLATGHWDGTLILIDAATGKELTRLQKGVGRKFAKISAQLWLPTIQFSHDSKMLASHRANEPVRVWDVAKGKEMATFQSHTDLLSFSRDGKRLAGHDALGTVRIWDLDKKEVLTVIETKKRAKAIAFSANGRMLVTMPSSEQGNVEVSVWEIATGKESFTASGVSAHLVAEGRTLSVLSMDGRITLWDLNTGDKRGAIEVYSADK